MTPTTSDLLAAYRDARDWFYAEREQFYDAQDAGNISLTRIMRDALTRAMARRIEAETAVALAWLDGRDPDTVQLPSNTDDTRDIRACVIAHLARRDVLREITAIPAPPHLKLTPDRPRPTAKQFAAMYAGAILRGEK